MFVARCPRHSHSGLSDWPQQRFAAAVSVDQSDGAMTKATIEAGMPAYAVDALWADRIKPILVAAIARFHML